MGRRPLLLNEEYIRKAQELAAQGLSDRAICTALGISPETFYEWIRKGEAGRQPYVDFARAVKKGLQQFESVCVNGILEAAKKNWTAYAWLLERRLPEVWGKRERIEIAPSWADLLRQ
jgi:transposase